MVIDYVISGWIRPNHGTYRRLSRFIFYFIYTFCRTSTMHRATYLTFSGFSPAIEIRELLAM